jgi:hypothetical protein
MGMLEIINALHVRADGPVVTADISLDHEAVNRIVSIVLLGVQAGAAFAEPVDEQDAPHPENQTDHQGSVGPSEDLEP